MNIVRFLAIVLIVAGILGLVYGSFTFTTNTHKASLGSIDLSVNDRQTVYIPVGVGVGAIVAGALLLLVSKRS